jgi:hypothetical protein
MILIKACVANENRRGDIMMKIFQSIKKNIDADKTLKLIIELSRNEKTKPEALEKCKHLVTEYPHDVQTRRRLLLLQKEMGLEIDLPEISRSSYPLK